MVLLVLLLYLRQHHVALVLRHSGSENSFENGVRRVTIREQWEMLERKDKCLWCFALASFPMWIAFFTMSILLHVVSGAAVSLFLELYWGFCVGNGAVLLIPVVIFHERRNPVGVHQHVTPQERGLIGDNGVRTGHQIILHTLSIQHHQPPAHYWDKYIDNVDK